MDVESDLNNEDDIYEQNNEDETDEAGKYTFGSRTGGNKMPPLKKINEIEHLNLHKKESHSHRRNHSELPILNRNTNLNKRHEHSTKTQRRRLRRVHTANSHIASNDKYQHY